jgi:glucosamine--fructose-6-phosphate aminotransferase (isomerizing)
MLEEAREGPACAARLLAADAPRAHDLAQELRERPPTAILTVARGSSDHAASFLAYLVMARLGRVVASLPMSVVTLYQSRLRCEGLVAFAFSQSGRSPDLVAPISAVGAGGGRTVAFVNDIDSPLAQCAHWTFGLHAGAETSVAATKSFLAQLIAGARLVGDWQADEALRAGLAALPADLRRALRMDWSAALCETLRCAERLYVISRGTGLAIAKEAALKLKEVCGIQAEAFSGAELHHGPMALIEEGYPLLVFAPPGPAQAGLIQLAKDLRGRGARVLLAAPEDTPGMELPLACSIAEDLDPILAIQSFYLAAEALARARGLDPDRPRHLAKVTKTL